ncbi:MAG: hypothetical protein CHACPFDD_04004 [Phycisphaerae bacterium]|nr:hypothetical protein [Phycisphaerae bacterium]
MTEQEFRNLLPLYADGELAPEQRRAVEAHLASSPRDRAAVDRWRALRRATRRVVENQPMPPALRGRVAGVLATHRRAAGSPARSRWTLAAAAAILLAAAGVWQFTRPHGGPAQPAPAPAAVTLVAAQDFGAIYKLCGVGSHDTESCSGHCPKEVHDRIAQAHGFRVLLPDLSDSGYALRGVCPCFGRHDLRVVHASYQKPDGAVVSVFSIDQTVSLRRDARGSNCDHERTGRRDYELAVLDDKVAVVKWDAHRQSFAFCSEIPANDLRVLADSVDVARTIDYSAFAMLAFLGY